MANVTLDFNNPLKEIVWVVQQDRMLLSHEWFNYTNRQRLYYKEMVLIQNIHRSLSDLEVYRVAQYNAARDENLLKEVHIDYLIGTIDEAKWTQSIFLKETNFEKKICLASDN